MNHQLPAVRRPGCLATVLPLLAFFPTAAACGEPPPPDEGDDLPEPTESAPIALEMAEAVAGAPDNFHIKSVNATGGSGCPQGSVSTSLSADGTSLSLVFAKYVATMGPGIPLPQSRRNCNINMTVAVPQGFSFTITQIDNRGSVDIPSGVTASQRSTYRMQGIPGEGTPQLTQFKGPAKRNFVASNKIDIPKLVFSACGQETNVNVATSIRLQGSRTKKSTIAIDSLDQNFAQLYHFGFKKCNQ